MRRPWRRRTRRTMPLDDGRHAALGPHRCHAHARHGFVTTGYGRQRLVSGRAAFGRDCQRRRDHDRAGMAHGDIMGVVELVAMRRRAVNQSGDARRYGEHRTDQRRRAAAREAARPLDQFLRPRKRGADPGDAETIEDEPAQLLAVCARQPIAADRQNLSRKVERHILRCRHRKALARRMITGRQIWPRASRGKPRCLRSCLRCCRSRSPGSARTPPRRRDPSARRRARPVWHRQG